MCKLLTVIILIFTANIARAQTNGNENQMFDFDEAFEQDVKFVLSDNYSHYLFSANNTYGIGANKGVAILRKFDQKSQLLDQYILNFPQIDDRTAYSYLGSFEMDKDRLMILSESLSGKAKKKEIHYHIFDKKTGEFKTTLLNSFTVESDYKSGTILFSVSHNRKYFGIAFREHAGRKDPKITHITVMQTDGLTKSIEKKVTFDDNFFDKSFELTNSGKAILLRRLYGMKIQNTLLEVNSTNERELPLDENMLLQHPVAISIGQKEYLVDFNYTTKGIRSNDFNKIMLYDIEAAQVVKNNDVKVFNPIPELKDIIIRRIDILNERINIFVEAKYKDGTKAAKSNALSAVEISVDAYGYGHPHVISMDYNGAVQNIKPLKRAFTNLSEIHRSFGVSLVNGNYYLADDYGFCQVNLDAQEDAYLYSRNPNDSYVNNKLWVNQLSIYKPDSKELILTKSNNGKMWLIHRNVENK
ncbi:hypothetical protein [Paenimyroides viscosum]|uniref:Uncharacterized protein n=1 Tax=Paenimyroides viscosum TaxID=2488729 RepID=A0A3P1AU10_9FLAO|nr:hypothetical protein [Paenimyroides viscosum]RRA92428.1 hypothetical protein EG242_11090 [Paenimyroides viscosum]